MWVWHVSSSQKLRQAKKYIKKNATKEITNLENTVLVVFSIASRSSITIHRLIGVESELF